jgi:hypothetical protein
MYIKIDCACIGVIFGSTLVLLIILLTLDGVGLKQNLIFDLHFILNDRVFSFLHKKCKNYLKKRIKNC